MLDAVPVAQVLVFEKEFLQFLHTEHAGLLAEVGKVREFAGDAEGRFKEAVKRFGTLWKEKHGAKA
jgi:F0F1-type ATP synthase alpha subunit